MLLLFRTNFTFGQQCSLGRVVVQLLITVGKPNALHAFAMGQVVAASMASKHLSHLSPICTEVAVPSCWKPWECCCNI